MNSHKRSYWFSEKLPGNTCQLSFLLDCSSYHLQWDLQEKQSASTLIMANLKQCFTSGLTMETPLFCHWFKTLSFMTSSFWTQKLQEQALIRHLYLTNAQKRHSSSACLFRAAQPRLTAQHRLTPVLNSNTGLSITSQNTQDPPIPFHPEQLQNSISAHPKSILKEQTPLLLKTRICIKTPVGSFFILLGVVWWCLLFFCLSQRLNLSIPILLAENNHCATWSLILACLPSCFFLPLLHTCTASERRIGCAQSHSSL